MEEFAAVHGDHDFIEKECDALNEIVSCYEDPAMKSQLPGDDYNNIYLISGQK